MMAKDIYIIQKLGAAFLLLSMIAGVSLAGTYDFNPYTGYCLKYKQDAQTDVRGDGFMVIYQRVNTNNLSLLEYGHGSGTFDQADLLASEQKTNHYNTYNYYDDNGLWVEAPGGANSVINFTKQTDNTQSPTTFAYGTGWYSQHPVVYNSLLKDKTVAKSYQEATEMHHQIEYARGVKGDIAVDINCTGPSETENGKGLTSMRVEDDVIQGTLHIGELQTQPLLKSSGSPISMKEQAWKKALIEIDENYIGNFHVQKNMEICISKSHAWPGEDWLPCCHGGFADIPYAKMLQGETGIFDCSCRNVSISSFSPSWDGTVAQFPTATYRTTP